MEEYLNKDFTEKEIEAIRKYQEHLLGLVHKAQNLLKYPASRLGSVLDQLYDDIGDYFPFNVEFD